jgi:hypothetical protein
VLARCRVVEANDAYALLFGAAWTAEAGAWPALCLDLDTLRSVLVRAERSPHAEVHFARPDSQVRVVRVSTVHLAEFGADRLLVVCHDLTDFKERVELEKDRQLIGTLQHEEKNTHQSQELDVQRARDRMGVVRECIDERRAVAAKFHTPGLVELWDDFQRGLGGALDEADTILQDIAARARDAQQQAHARIMRARGFTGVVAIVSGEGEDGLQRLRATPGVDLVVGKGALHDGRLIEQLRKTLVAKRGGGGGGNREGGGRAEPLQNGDGKG